VAVDLAAVEDSVALAVEVLAVVVHPVDGDLV